MPLGPGARLGPYEIVAAIGAGGMGEVYRARDTRLQRDVAIKVLPDAFAADADRLARFEREAQLLASLNHPHIGAIYGLEDRALILELVDGETLADRIARGPVPVDEAIAIARQIAEALEAAHEQGIIHRDLKPSNIKITPDGHVKVLDFGLAKLNEPNVSNASDGPNAFSMSPTITSPMMTGIGVLLGTAAYMAPEQAKGKPADKRSDIWAFGCVMYEMLTGKRAFDGEDVSDTLAAVLRGMPDWNALPAGAAPRVQSILRRCLEKDRKARIPDISAVRFLMDDAVSFVPRANDAADAAAGARPSSVRLWQAIAALMALAAVAASATWWSVARPISPRATRFFVYPPDKARFVTSATGRPGANVAISPDGTRLAFTARDESGKVLLWMRPLDSLTAQPLPGTDDATYPFWSPDSRFIAFWAQEKLMKIAAGGGPPQLLTANTTNGRGGTWNRAGTIVFNTGGAGTLSRVSSAGGQATEFMHPTNGQIGYVFPWFLPDGSHFLYYVYGVSEEATGVYVGSLDSADSKRLTSADTAAIYDSQSGHLLFVRRGTLLAQPFDVEALALGGEPVPIAEHVEASVVQGVPAFSVSDKGIMAYGVGSDTLSSGLQLTWVDRQGKEQATAAPPANYRGIDLAPDGKRVATHRHDGAGGDIWITDLSRGITSRFTFEASQENSAPIWSPDATRIVYESFRNGKSGLYQKAANNTGSEDLLLESDVTVAPMSWSSDGRWVVYETIDPKTTNDLWVLPMTGDRKATAFLRTPFGESHAQISPDGHWLAYSSNETGRSEIYVQPFPGGAGKWQVSANGGSFPRWRPDGRELFYMSSASGGNIMAVEVASRGSMFEAGSPKELIDSRYINLTHTGTTSGAGPYHTFAVSADGQRFLIPYPPSNESSAVTMPIAVVENWAADLTK